MGYKNGQNLHRILHSHIFKAYKHLNNNRLCLCGKDLKSCEGNLVRVRFPPLAPIQAGLKVGLVSRLKKQGQGFAEFLVQVFKALRLDSQCCGIEPGF